MRPRRCSTPIWTPRAARAQPHAAGTSGARPQCEPPVCAGTDRPRRCTRRRVASGRPLHRTRRGLPARSPWASDRPVLRAFVRFHARCGGRSRCARRRGRYQAFAGKSPVLQRRGRDSNPRSACTDSGFQDQRIRPLCHPSGVAGAMLPRHPTESPMRQQQWMPTCANQRSRLAQAEPRRGGRVAEGTRLLSEYGVNTPSRVRIPPPPLVSDGPSGADALAWLRRRD